MGYNYLECAVMKDYYYILGLKKGADAFKIKKAYRSIVKKSHPDVDHTPDSSERFKEIQEAYNTLRDEIKRKEYDRELDKKQSANTVPVNIIKRDTDKGFYEANVADSLFPGVTSEVENYLFHFTRGNEYVIDDLYLEIILTPEESLQGGKFQLTIPVTVRCPRAAGTIVGCSCFCPICKGQGVIRFKRELELTIPKRIAHNSFIKRSLEDIGFADSCLYITVLIKNLF